MTCATSQRCPRVALLLLALAVAIAMQVADANAQVPPSSAPVLALMPVRDSDKPAAWFAIAPNATDRMDVALSVTAASSPELTVAVVSGDPNGGRERAVLRRTPAGTATAFEAWANNGWARASDAFGNITYDGIVQLPVPTGTQAGDTVWVTVQSGANAAGEHVSPLYSLTQLRAKPASKLTTLASGWLRSPNGEILQAERFDTQPAVTLTRGRVLLSFASGLGSANPSGATIEDVMSIQTGGAQSDRRFELRFDHTSRFLRAYRANSDIALTDSGAEASGTATTATPKQAAGVTWAQPNRSNSVPLEKAQGAFLVDLSAGQASNISLGRQRLEEIIGGSLGNGTLVSMSRRVTYEDGRTLTLESVSVNAEQGEDAAPPERRKPASGVSKRAIAIVLVAVAIPFGVLLITYRRWFSRHVKNQWRRSKLKKRRRREMRRVPAKERS
ncbi:MAG: hypothetical protein HYX32_06290 [Actinobacteria bacterium]|nr:hypothetical protein [Actinomycetota bacterium]